MADKLQPKLNDRPLSRENALRASEITRSDIRRAADKWLRRDPLFFEKIRDAAGQVNNAGQ